MTMMVSTAVMTYDKTRRQLIMPSEYASGQFPRELTVVSHHTGRTVVFEQDIDGAIMYDYWDGEQMLYKSKYESVDITMVIYHAF